MTPYELWFSKKPKPSFLKVWGCDAYVKKFHPDKARTQIREGCLHRIPKKKLLGTPSTTDPKARSLLPRMDPF